MHDVPALLAAEGAARRRAAPPARTGRRPWSRSAGCPRADMASRRPRLLITVATRVSSVSVPASRMASARIAMIWSPSTTSPSAVDRQAAVGVAVVGDAQVGAVLDHGRPQRVEVVGAAVVVDVEPVRLGVDRDRPRRRPPGRRPGRPRQAAPLAQSTTTLMPVEPVRRRCRPGAARSGRRRRAGRAPGRRRRRSAGRQAAVAFASTAASIRSSISSGSLCPPAAKSLMPLSGIGLCEAESITPEVGLGLGGQERHAPGSAARRPGSRWRRRWSARPPRRPRASRRWPGCPGRPPPAAGGCGRVSARVCAAATATASASSGVRSALARPRTPSVPNNRPIPRQPPMTHCR